MAESREMKKRFYFQNEDGDEVGLEYTGTIRGARYKAEELAEKLNCNIYINTTDLDEIIDVIFA